MFRLGRLGHTQLLTYISYVLLRLDIYIILYFTTYIPLCTLPLTFYKQSNIQDISNIFLIQ